MFYECETLEDAKKLFRKLALRLHPDHGGSSELMNLLNNSHERFLDDFEEKTDFSNFQRNKNSEEEKTKEQKTDRKSNRKYRVDKEDPRAKVITDLRCYYDKTGKINTFFESVYLYFNQNGSITISQYECLLKNAQSLNLEGYVS